MSIREVVRDNLHLATRIRESGTLTVKAVSCSWKDPLTLPSPARGEGFRTPSLDGRGNGEGDN